MGEWINGLKKINHGKLATFLAGDIRKTCGTHESTTVGGGDLGHNGIIHRRQMDTTHALKAICQLTHALKAICQL